MATVVISHTAHAFPFGQLDVVAGEQVEVVERFDSGWWEVKKADGRVGRVPSNKLDEQGAPQEQLRRSLSRSLSRRTLSTRPLSRRADQPSPPALPEGRAGSPRSEEPPAGLTKMEQIKWKREQHLRQPPALPPPGLTKMQQIKWKEEQHRRTQRASAGYGGDPAPSAAPADVHLDAEPASEPVPSWCSHVGAKVGIELQRVAYSVWSKYLTAFCAGLVALLSAMLLVCDIEEEANISSMVAQTDGLEGTLTSVNVTGALVSLVVAVLLVLNERFWKLLPPRKEQKEGTLWVRMGLLVVLLVLQLVSSPILLGFAVVLLPICITAAGMRLGERDQPWPVQRGATKLEREDLEERKELRRLAREAGAASLCAEQIYRIREEDSLGRHVILTFYILCNVYKFLEAYSRWVGIVDDQGTCCQVCEGTCADDGLCIDDSDGTLLTMRWPADCSEKRDSGDESSAPSCPAGESCSGRCSYLGPTGGILADPQAKQACSNGEAFADGRFICLADNPGECELKLSYWAPVAKAAGACLNLNCSLILLPVLWHTLHYAHKKMKWCPVRCLRCRIAKKVPLGENVVFHKLVAYTIALFATIHTFAHYVNYYSKPTAVETAFAVARWYGIPGLDWKWVTGVVTTLCILVMYSAAQDATRRHSHKAFWLSHQLFGVFWLCLLLHGPVFYQWITIPLILYFVHRARIGRHPAILREVTLEEPNVVRLAFDNTDNRLFGGKPYKEGTYVRIQAPDLSVTEWHPFTISSAPHEDVLTVHIKVTSRRDGIVSWTEALRTYLRSWYSPNSEHGNLMLYTEESPGSGRLTIGRSLSLSGGPLLRVDGPHAAPCIHIPHYDTVMLVAGGIGLTPFASALKALIQYKLQQAVDPREQKRIRPRYIYFYWLFQMADYESFQWFAKLLARLRLVYLKEKVRYDRHTTSGAGVGHMQSVQLRINLIITRGDARHDKPASKPKEQLQAKCNGVPQYSVREKDGKYVGKVIVDDLGLEDLGKEAGQPRSITGAAAKTPQDAERLAAARALEALSVKQQVEDVHAAGYAEACLSPQGDDLRRFRALEDYTPSNAEEHALSFKKGDEIILTSTSWHDSDTWVHGKHTASGTCGGFPPTKVRKPVLQHVPTGMEDPNVVAVRTGSIRGAGWGKYFEQVKADVQRRCREEKAGGQTAGGRRKSRCGPVADALDKEGENQIGVFCCGPMGADLRANCIKHGDLAREGEGAENSTVFQLHAEVF